MRNFFLLMFIFSFIFAFNILPNPSFEIWLDTLGVKMPFGWLTSEILRESSAVKSTYAYSGNYSLYLRGEDTLAFAHTLTIVRPNYSYYFFGFAHCRTFISGSFSFYFLDSLFNLIGMPIVIPLYFSNNYREYARWFTAPNSARFLLVSLIALPQARIYFDSLTLEDTSLNVIKEGNSLLKGAKKFKKILILKEKKFDYKNCYSPLGKKLRTPFLKKGIYFENPLH
uniref:Uncharacterized protein n=1 Tax=candidate division WOR-3 bacterium TaxID=2052148 RepID=A0A7V4E335_UNCW3